MGTIFLSAGHSLQTPGASTVFGTTEAEEMMRARDATVQALQRRGVAVVAVSDTLSLATTITFINAHAVGGDVAVEIHGNSAAASARGTEAFFIAGNAQRKFDAERLLNALVSKVPGLNNRGAKPDNQSQHPRLAFCRDIRIPSVLIELCFLSNTDDMLLLHNHRDQFAEGLADGLQVWSGQTGARPSAPPFPTIAIHVNNQPEQDTGILVNNNAFLPIDLVDRLGIALAHTPDDHRIRQGNIVYVKAIDLDQFHVSVRFDPATQTVTLNTLARNVLEHADHIMGQGKTAAEQLADFFRMQHAEGLQQFPTLPQLYVEEAALEGVNHDVAFCQMCLETGFLEFGGDVAPAQNNFCGLGATGGGAQGAVFADARTGVKAHIQHLKAYGSDQPIARPPTVDPRFDLVRRNVAPSVHGLSGRWASDPRYGEKIMSLIKKLYTTTGLLV